MGSDGTEVLQDVLCLPRDAHGLWGKARFALKPVQMSVNSKVLTCAVFLDSLKKFKKLNGTIWKEAKEVLNGLKGKRDGEITTPKRQLEDTNNVLPGKQQRFDSLLFHKT
ncbi:hypothetical protein COH20_012452 [Aspergillus flavus]|nr:hypothetical protein COH20_012452 [Aspergillus flavus]RAQ81755.1 hypothetical protein COH21_012472 [Aspergillus flavus]